MTTATLEKPRYQKLRASSNEEIANRLSKEPIHECRKDRGYKCVISTCLEFLHAGQSYRCIKNDPTLFAHEECIQRTATKNAALVNGERLDGVKRTRKIRRTKAKTASKAAPKRQAKPKRGKATKATPRSRKPKSPNMTVTIMSETEKQPVTTVRDEGYYKGWHDAMMWMNDNLLKQG